MNSKIFTIGALVSAMLVLFILSGCTTPKGPILVTGAYEAPQGLEKSPHKVVVGVSPFQDGRGKKPSLVGERVNAEGTFENDLVVQGTASELVTAALKKALRDRGITVQDVPAWDLAIDNLKASGADIVIGGSVTALWTKAVAQALNANTRADVSLHIVAADAREKKIIRTLDLNGMYERRALSFDPDRVGEAISASLSQTLDQLMNDTEIQKRLQ
jgi:uncharacterized lipoprotein YajG